MLQNFRSSIIFSRRSQEHLFTGISIGQERYRILTRNCNKTIDALMNVQIFWGLVTLIQGAALIDHYLHAKPGFIVFICAFFGVLMTTLLALKRRKTLLAMVIYSLINLSLYLVILSILAWCQTKKLTIPTIVYIISQMLSSLILLQNKSKLLPKFLIALQLLAIISKLDGTLNCQWLEVYFGFLLVCFIAFIVLLSMIIFWTINILYFNQQPLSIKHIGLGFIFINSLSWIFISMLPISQQFFQIPFIIVCLFGIIINCITIIYGRIFILQIILFMCKVQKVKDFNQIITLVKIPNSSIQQYVFQRKSQHWYERITKNQAKITNSDAMQNSQKNHKNSTELYLNQSHNKKQNSNCLICMQIQPCMIWMPCGHLAVCQICSDKMFENRSCNCLLCKDIPQAIYHININNQILKQSIKISQKTSCQNHSQNYCSNLSTFQVSLAQEIQQNNEKYKCQLNIANENYNLLTIKYAYSIRIN